MPLPIEPALHARELSFAVLYGFLTALAFALWPLGRTHDVPVSALFATRSRRSAASRACATSASTVAVIATLAALAVLLAYDRKIAAIFVGGGGRRVPALQLVAMLIMAIARRVPARAMRCCGWFWPTSTGPAR